ncbi:hypothetical protein [Microbacterium sp. NPDC057650]|uniref:hypothetical protein n=1 Tax=unclassified Microbacterium TaxID=2609290 RepID=UPI00366E0E1E
MTGAPPTDRRAQRMRVLSSMVGGTLGVVTLVVFAFLIVITVTPSGSPYEDNSIFFAVFLAPIAVLLGMLSAVFIALAFQTGRRAIAFGASMLVVVLLIGLTVALWVLT